MPIVQNSVITQLGLKGIRPGNSPLQLEGALRDFFVDVDVDPMSGRGKFDATVGVELAVWHTELQKHIWRKAYTSTATSSAPSVVDSAYERTLKVAFVNLMNQLRQDDSLLKLTPITKPSPPESGDAASTSPVERAASPEQPSALQVVFLNPSLDDASPIITTDFTLPISGLAAGAHPIKKIEIHGAKIMRRAPAPPQDLKRAKLAGRGVRFQAYAFLTPGDNRIQVQVEDAQGNTAQQSMTIRRQDIVDNTKPQLVLLEPRVAPSPPSITAKPSQAIFGYAVDEHGIAEVRVNGTTASMTVASPEELQEAGLQGKGVKFAASAALEVGANALEILVRDLQRNELRRELTIQRGRKTAEPLDMKKMYPKSVAVVIGIDQYDAWPQLTYAVKDAKQMQQTLKGMGFDEVLMLTDREATRARLLRLLETELPQQVAENDRVVIFFAGHAHTAQAPDGQRVKYLLPVDAQRQTNAQMGIAMAQLRSVVEGLRVKHILYAIDACHADPFAMQGAGRAQGMFQKVRLSANGRTSQPAIHLVAAGCDSEQVVGEEGEGLFARFMRQGLQGEADMDNDQLITASELGMYLSRWVTVTSDNRQIPQYGQLAGTGEMVFAY